MVFGGHETIFSRREISEMIGQRFTRLTVIAFAGRSKSYEKMWLCRCDCGNEKVVRESNLKRGATRSCGCLQSESGKRAGEGKRRKNSWIVNEDGLTVTGIDEQGRRFTIDADDFEKVKSRYWRVDKRAYVFSFRYKQEVYTGAKRMQLHRYIMGDVPEGMVVDHINHDPTDNRKANLRIATAKDNSHNRKVCGVTYCEQCSNKPWAAAIQCGGIKRRKAFATAEEAIAQRLEWERELHGNFAYDPNTDAREDEIDRFSYVIEQGEITKARPHEAKPYIGTVKRLNNIEAYKSLVACGLSVKQVCRQLKISRSTYYNYREAVLNA